MHSLNWRYSLSVSSTANSKREERDLGCEDAAVGIVKAQIKAEPLHNKGDAKGSPERVRRVLPRAP